MRLNIDLTQGKVSRNLFFASDFHLFHNNVIRFDNRPFANVHEMHNVIESNWNEIVGPEDTVIYLGDLSFARAKDAHEVVEFVNRLNGTIHYVLGNHDKFDDIRKMNRFQSIQDYLEVRVRHWQDNKSVETLFCCMHYPIYSWNKSHHGSYMVHGHSHMSLSIGEFHKDKRIIDVGIMGYNYKPVSYQEIIAKLTCVDFKISTTHH